MYRRVIHVILCLSALFAGLHSLPSIRKGDFRRLRRQTSSLPGPSSLVPPRIPYASLSTGAIPSRIRNLLRSKKPSTPTSKSVSSEKPSSSGGESSSNRASSAYGANPYSGNTGYPYGGAYGGAGQSYGQRQAVAGNSGAVPVGAVPVGASTFPYGTGQGVSGYNNPYAGQPPPTANYRGAYQPTRYQTALGYQPQGGYGGGYGGLYPTGPNRYPYGGMYGGGYRQMQYANPYGMPQRGYYGTGYPSGGYPEVTNRASIGSPYRDPSSRFSSYIHPQAGSGGRYGGGSTSHSGGSYRSGSYYGGSDPYGSSSSRVRYPESGGSDSYGSRSSQVRYPEIGGSDSYGSSSSQVGYPESGGSRYYGGDPSSSNYGNTGPGYGQSVPSAGGSSSRYPSGVGYGANQQDTRQGTNSGSRYGTGSGSNGDASDYYGSRGSYSIPYTSVNSETGENPYGQTTGSRYGSSSGSGYNYGQPSGEQQQEPYDQSSVYHGYSQNEGGQAGDGQFGRYYNPSSETSQNYGSSSSRHQQSQQRHFASSQDDSRETSRLPDQIYNSGAGRQQSAPQSLPTNSPSYQTGRFYSPNEFVSGSVISAGPGSQQETANNLTDPSTNVQTFNSVARERPQGVVSRGRHRSEQGIFLIPRREGENANQGQVRGQDGDNGQHISKIHPASKKCQILGDGLPDLYVDYKKMKSSVIMERKTLNELSCAKSENCLAESAYKANAMPVRKLLKFATITHNVGTANFLPDTHHKDWVFHSCHNHWHSMKEFAHFYLLRKNGTVAAEGHKVSFCLEDSGCKNPCKKKFECSRDTQGISPGCYDSYLASRDCQWIDITEVPPGTYTLRVVVNPLVDGVRAVPELSYTNNAAECTVTIAMTYAEANKCWMK